MGQLQFGKILELFYPELPLHTVQIKLFTHYKQISKQALHSSKAGRSS